MMFYFLLMLLGCNQRESKSSSVEASYSEMEDDRELIGGPNYSRGPHLRPASYSQRDSTTKPRTFTEEARYSEMEDYIGVEGRYNYSRGDYFRPTSYSQTDRAAEVASETPYEYYYKPLEETASNYNTSNSVDQFAQSTNVPVPPVTTDMKVKEISDWKEFVVRYFLNEDGMQTADNKVKLLGYIRNLEENPFFNRKLSLRGRLFDSKYPEFKELIKSGSLDEHARSVLANGNNDIDYKFKMSLLVFCYFMKLGDKEIWDTIIGNKVFAEKLLNIPVPGVVDIWENKGKRGYEFYEIAIIFSNLDALKASLSVDGIRNNDHMAIIYNKPQSLTDSEEFSTSNDLAIVQYLLTESKNYKDQNAAYKNDRFIIPNSDSSYYESKNTRLRLINEYILEHNKKYPSLY